MDKSRAPAPRKKPSLVRPYTLTAGRTNASVALPLAAPIEARKSARNRRWPPNDMRGDIVKLCATRLQLVGGRAPGADREDAAWPPHALRRGRSHRRRS